MKMKRKERTKFRVFWTMCEEKQRCIEISKPFFNTKKIRIFSWWKLWLLRSVPMQQHTEDGVVIYFKRRKGTIYLIAIENK